MYLRVEVAVRPEYADPEADAFLRRVELAHPEIHRQIRWARMLDVYWMYVEESREQIISGVLELFQDKVLKWLITGDLIPSAAGKSGRIQDLMASAPHRPGNFWALEKHFRAGVTDNVARTALEAFEIILGKKLQEPLSSSGKLLLLEGTELQEEPLAVMARDLFSNELIESWSVLTQEEMVSNSRFHADQVKRQLPRVQVKGGLKSKNPAPENKTGKENVELIQLHGLSDEQLVELSRKRLWALTLEEMKAVRSHFGDPEEIERRKALGLTGITDVEMEVIAQTWSEHCKHKIFNAHIQYADESPKNTYPTAGAEIPSQVDSLFKTTIAGTTRELPRPWLLSVFVDNAGILAFDEETAFCMKVETHNSPSALDPYGGALTGIVGVNRDILGCGAGAKPIFNTNVFCVAVPDYPKSLPERLLHPRRILEGIRRGVEDGGNKSGIPTVNGALVFDPRYLGKPLVYCGTGGILPRNINGQPCEIKEIKPGDRICMVGGRVGKDGIHGATFSSLALDNSSPVTAVQLGDPITQKRMSDFLLEARDAGLYRTLTDNGAGGLSSSVGELAELSGGARMDVAHAKVKYPGLKPYELTVSESQERMTVAVPPESLRAFVELAEHRGVEVSVLGSFTDNGTFEILYDDQVVGSLRLSFLHKGVPRMEISARWKGEPARPGTTYRSFEKEGGAMLLELLGRPNVASKEWLIRQYDHEVQGNSVVKPLHTVGSGTEDETSGPNDAGVLKPKHNSWAGMAVGCGINPKYSDVDPYLMAQMSVDESVRNILAVGAEFGEPESVVALVDNFCWPDPVSDEGKAAALVRACFGMREAALALRAPLISGKDSMKNDFRGNFKDGKPVSISVPPTLLMTAVGKVPDVRNARTADFKSPGDQIYILGGKNLGLVGSELHSTQVENLLARGGNQQQVVLPSAIPGGHEQTGDLHVARPDWTMARRIYSWLGGTVGKKQNLLRSVHDVSEGGLLVAVAESLLARGFGADLIFPPNHDLWEFGFGEGFHTFVVSVPEMESSTAEGDWAEQGVPFTRLGSVTYGGKLDVRWADGENKKHWSVSVEDIRTAWKREGYWE